MKKSNLLNDTRLNFTQKDGISTFGIAFGLDNTNPFNTLGHVKKIFNEKIPNNIPSKPVQGAAESDVDYAERLKVYAKQLAWIQIPYMEAMAKKSVSFLIGYNISLFELIGGDPVKNSDSLVSNKYSVKSHNFSADFNYGFNKDFGVSLGAAYIKKRQSAVEDQKMIDYIGYNVGISWRAICLKDGDELKNDDDYLKSFFIPSIVIGCSYEYQKANGDSKYFENGIAYQHVITPYLDFKISPKNQFRLGVPIKRYDSVNKTQVGLGPFIQYSLSLSDTN
ncbi:MAG: hypothetical protein JSS79_13810 [Bacteroidetes bacterium]|nr:hypothetical protein [Bacteroidota bacterium]